jgi:adenine-specific DNA-methyltransferase
MDFNHLPLTTEDGTQVNLNALYKIAPSCFTEVRNEKTGELRHVVDFKKLLQLLGDNAVEDEPEAYEFTWVGKQAARREAATPINKTLRPVPESSVDWDHTQNIYIEGDNLDALKLLQKSYLGKVKMIYIDPPYNTGNDFVYHDDFHRSQSEEDLEAGNVDELGNRFLKNTETNGKFHSDWCSMIYPRLQLAHSLLREDGVIFISIDDHEIENLKKICCEIYGESNFVAIINWRRSGGRQDSKYYAIIHEYILCFAKDIDKFQAGEEIKSENVYPKYDEVNKRYYKTQLLRKWGANSLRENRPNLYYPIKGPHGEDIYPTIYLADQRNSALGFKKIQGRWRWGASTMAKAIEEGRVEFQENKYGELIPYERIYAPKAGEEKTNKYTTWIDDVSNGTDTIKGLFSKTIFDYSKSPQLVGRFLKMADLEDNDLVLDFFSGSATTAHAVMQLNAEDGGHRKFILVQLPEETSEDSEAYKAGYKNICEIGEERIRRAGKKIKEEKQGAALVAVRNGKSSQGDLFTQGNQEADGHKGRTLQEHDLDTGFRVFRIDSSNMKDVYFAPKDLEPQQLELFADNVKEDRTELDLLYGCMVDWGVQLSLPLTKETIDVADGHKGRTLQADGNGVTVYTVNDGDLVACFGKPITDNVVKVMADKAPLRVLFRDSCFEKDEQKINIFEQFKQLLGWSDDEALNNIRVI